MEEVVVSGFSEQKRPEPKICPLRALAYTIAGIPAKVQEPLCIGPRCAWFIPVDDVEVGDVVVKVGTAKHIQLELNNPVKTKSLRGPYLTWVRLVLKGGAVVEGRLDDTVFVEEADA